MGVTRLTCALTPCRGSRSGEGAGAWRSQVAHSLGVRVVGRSNRLAPTLLLGATAQLAGGRWWWHPAPSAAWMPRSEEHTSELQSHSDLVCRLLLEKKK